MQKLTVWFQGVRDDGYTKKGETVRTERYLADVYLPGSGAFDISVTRAVYEKLLLAKPMTEAILPMSLEIRQDVQKSANGNAYARRNLTPKFGDLELVAASAPVAAPAPVGRAS